MKCYFNSCPLNEEYYFKQYKKAFPEKKELFQSLEPNDDIVKASKLISNSKKYHFCIEHIEKLILFKTIKEKLEAVQSQESSSTLINQAKFNSTLEQLNSLIRFDDNIKALCFKIDKIDPVSLILSQLGKSDRIIDMLLLLNLTHFLKEISYAKKYSTNDLYLSITDYYCNYIYSPYESITKFTSDEKERMTRDTILQGLLLDNMRHIIANAKEKGLRLDITTKVIVKSMELMSTVLTRQRPNDTSSLNKTQANEDYIATICLIEKMIISSAVQFIYALLISKNSQIDLNTSTVKVFCKLSREVFGFIKQANDSQLRKEYIILVNELLYVMIHTQCDQLEIDNVKLFISECESFMSLEGTELIEEKIRNSIVIVKEKMRIYSNKSFIK